MDEYSNQEAAVLAAIQDILSGNTESYRVIVDTYERQMYHLALNYLASREDAEEAVQEIFIKIYNNLDKFSLDRRFFPWMYTIALNYLKTKYKKIKRRGSRQKDLQEDEEMERMPASDNPEEEYQHMETRQELRNAVDRLPDKYREVILLFYFQGMDVEGITEVMDIGKENVKSRLFRARKKLKEILDSGI